MSSDLNNVITADECKMLIEKKLGTNQFQLNKYFIETNSKIKTGYLAEHLCLTCEIVFSNEIETILFFVKKKLQDSSENIVATISENHDVFRNEKTILELVANHSVVPATFVAKFYYYNDAKQYIVMENLTERGFMLSKTQLLLDYKHCQVLLEAIAKFHTFSFKYQHDKQKVAPNYSMFDEFNDLFEEVLFHYNNDFAEKWMETTRMCLINLVDYLGPGQKMSKERLKELINDKFHLLVDHSKSYKHQYNICSHGDLWANNLMFRYSKDNENEPVECCLVDLQVLRFLPPAEDVLFSLYLNTCKEFRDQYLDQLIDHYYKSLTEELNKVGLDSSLVYPLCEYRKHLKERLLHVLFIDCIYKSTLWMPADRVNELMSDKEHCFQILLGDRWKYMEEELQTNIDYKTRYLQEFQQLIDEIVNYK